MELMKIKMHHNYIRGNVALGLCAFAVLVEYIDMFTPLNFGLSPLFLGIGSFLFVISLYFRLSSKRRKKDNIALAYAVVFSSMVILYYLNMIKKSNLVV